MFSLWAEMKIALVRYGKAKNRQHCTVGDGDFKQHDQCLIETDRGFEIGTLLTDPFDDDKTETIGTILHPLQVEEEKLAKDIEQNLVVQIKQFCKEQIKDLDLPMKLIDVEHSLNGKKITVMYEAANRIDFRTLVKRLARKYRTRIEMRQISSRMSAKVLGDVGPCGQQLCCTRFLDGFPPVNAGMAVRQNIPTGDPRLGRCGELKCCLRYEDGQYIQGECHGGHGGGTAHCDCGKNESSAFVV